MTLAKLDLPALSIRASVEPATLNLEKRTVDVCWTTGARVRRGFWDVYDEELSMNPKHVRMERLQSGRAPVLDNHNSYDGAAAVRGVVQSAKISGKVGTATLRFAKAEDEEDGGKLFRKIADGIIANVSVGYRIHKMELVEAGDAQSGVVPVYRAVDWEPFEISPVGIGADAGAGFRSGPTNTTNPCEFVERSEDTEMAIAKTPVVAAIAVAEATRADVDVAEATRTEEVKAASSAATAAEQSRALEIRKLVRSVKLDEGFADKLIADCATTEASRQAVLTELVAREEKTPTNPHHRMEIGEDEHDKFRNQATAALILRAGLQGLFAAAKAKDPERFGKISLDPGKCRNLNLADLAQRCLMRRGIDAESMDRMTMVGRALTYRAGGQSTSDFATLMEGAAVKVLLAAYATTADKWEGFCKVASVNDFKASPRYRAGSFGRLDAVLEDGEFKHKAIPDGTKNTIQAGTVGNIIALTRQAIINDDLGAFTDLAQKLGRAAKLTIEMAVFDMLLENAGLGPTMADSLALFDAGHANIGTPAAISVLSIEADKVLMASQQDHDGHEILDIRPTTLLVPIGLGGTARVINTSQFDPDTANKLQRPNQAQGTYSNIIDTPRLTGTRRYSFADPNVAEVFVVSFLNGDREPKVEQRDGWDVDGTEWKVRLDFGVDVTDHRGAITNAGV